MTVRLRIGESGTVASPYGTMFALDGAPAEGESGYTSGSEDMLRPHLVSSLTTVDGPALCGHRPRSVWVIRFIGFRTAFVPAHDLDRPSAKGAACWACVAAAYEKLTAVLWHDERERFFEVVDSSTG